MCAVRKQYLIKVEDLRYVCIVCTNCTAEITLDMQELSAFAEVHGFFAPVECPGCRQGIDSGLRKAVDELQRAYGALRAFSDNVKFVCEAEE